MGYDSAGIDDGADEPVFVPPPPHVDLFEQCKPPKGKVYQWVTISVMGVPDRSWQRHLDSGWNWVRTKRHPKFRSDTKDWISYQGQALMEMPRKKWEKLAVVPIEAARKMDGKYRGVMTGDAKFKSYSVSDFPNHWAAYTSTYVPIPSDAPPIIVSATIQIVADAKWQDAAAVCALTIEEYVQRRVSVAASHIEVALLIPKGNRSFEFIENVKWTRGSDV